ncbi:hypothetical protein [Dendronalium sp. ChiSLP03b]|nr:hypothetical protein [Dendronalium sp. ChiSLP03b]MDZ8203926.1 hypothetical protein [Dendronalium sp. ChiSLP03b]
MDLFIIVVPSDRLTDKGWLVRSLLFWNCESSVTTQLVVYLLVSRTLGQ